MFSPEDSIEECKEAFYLYDRRGDKKVECSQIGEVMRALGTNPTEGEIAKIIRSLDPAGTGVKRVSFEEFFPIYQNLRDRQKKSGGKFCYVMSFIFSYLKADVTIHNLQCMRKNFVFPNFVLIFCIICKLFLRKLT